MWLKRIGRLDLKDLPLDKLKNYYVCSDHFPETAFTSSLRLRLLKFANPMDISLEEDEESGKEVIEF